MSDLAAAIGAGFQLGAAFNPLASLIGAVLAAAIIATGRGWRRVAAGVAVLVLGWMVGDGWILIESGRAIAEGNPLVVQAEPWASWTALGIWGAAGLLIGYGVPALAGAYAGRRVVWGTGWLTAGSLAAAVSAAIAQILRSGF